MDQSRKGIKSLKKQSGVSLWMLLLFSLIVSILVLSIGIAVFSHIYDIKFWTKDTLKAINGSSLCYFDDEWDSGTYLSAITSFYTTVITLLIAIQAIISWIAFVIIKNSSKDNIDSAVEDELPRFMQTPAARDVLKQVDDDRIASLKSDIEGLNNKLLALYENLDIDSGDSTLNSEHIQQ